MRAALVTDLEALPTVGERAEPAPAEGQVILDVATVALNPVDVAIAAGRFYAGHPPLPFVPGIEAVGRVGRDRLVYAQGGGLGIAADGFAAERVAVADAALIDLPPDADPATAVALGTAGLAGWLSVIKRAAVAKGDVVVVLGGTGAVGRVALQAARRCGASRVVAVGRSQERLAELGGLVDATVPLGEDFAERTLEAAGAPPTVVIDMLWGDSLAAILGTLAPGARVVHVGASASSQAAIPSAAVRGKQLSILGYSNFGQPRDDLAKAYRELVSLATAGEVSLPTRQFDLADVSEAWTTAASGAAKVVLRISTGAQPGSAP